MRIFSQKSLQRAAAVVTGAVLTACQTVTPATRIQENPVLFRSLSPEQQLMVQQGRICEGMSKDAVFLAWGNPNSAPLSGEKDGHRYERWVYTYSRAVPVDGFGSGWYGDPWCRHGWGPGVGMNVAYVPEVGASVTFENGKVTAWERKGN